jgi:Gluconolactonase
MISERSLAVGVRTLGKRMSGSLGRGTSAASRCINSRGDIPIGVVPSLGLLIRRPRNGALFQSVKCGDLEQGGGTIFKIDQSGKVEYVFPGGHHADLQNPNRLLIDDNNALLVADFVTGALQRVDLTSGEATLVAGGLGAADGIAKTSNGQLYVSDPKARS